jgi:hypothetical protein
MCAPEDQRKSSDNQRERTELIEEFLWMANFGLWRKVAVPQHSIHEVQTSDRRAI